MRQRNGLQTICIGNDIEKVMMIWVNYIRPWMERLPFIFRIREQKLYSYKLYDAQSYEPRLTLLNPLFAPLISLVRFPPRNPFFLK